MRNWWSVWHETVSFQWWAVRPTSSLISAHTDENSSETTALGFIMLTLICSSRTVWPRRSHTAWRGQKWFKITHQNINDSSFTFIWLHLWLWVTSRHVQEPACLCHLLTPPDQHHLTIGCTQDATHTQRLSQQRQRIAELRFSQLTELCHSTRPVCSQVVFVAGQAQSESEEQSILVLACVFCRSVWSRVMQTIARKYILLHSSAAVWSVGWMLRRNRGQWGQAEWVQSELGPVEKPRLFGHTLCPRLVYFALQSWICPPVESERREEEVQPIISLLQLHFAHFKMAITKRMRPELFYTFHQWWLKAATENILLLQGQILVYRVLSIPICHMFEWLLFSRKAW